MYRIFFENCNEEAFTFTHEKTKNKLDMCASTKNGETRMPIESFSDQLRRNANRTEHYDNNESRFAHSFG